MQNIKFFKKENLDIVYEEYEKRRDIIQSSKKVYLIGLGGSYLATKAILDIMDLEDKIEFIGPYLDYDFSKMSKEDYFIIISKSGKTYEIKYILEKIEHLISDLNTTIITDKDSPLHLYSSKNRISSILYADKEVGGRFSAFDVSTIFPLTISGINIQEYISSIDAFSNEIYNNILNIRKEDADIELVSTNNKQLESFTKWYQQLFAESQGKNGKCTIPVTIVYPRDLHSLEQMIQDGRYSFTEINFNSGLNGISQNINNAAVEAHRDKGIEVVEIKDLKLSLAKDKLIKEVGKVISMFIQIVIEDSLRVGIDPFGQPGVERYKNRLTLI